MQSAEKMAEPGWKAFFATDEERDTGR